ncbi:MAG: hypothetical protein AAB781_02415 [Patescibacteria group bacterium]
MLNFDKNRNSGFIKSALIVIVTVVAIGFFADIKSIVDSKWDSKRLKNNFQYAKTLSISVWKGHISPAVHNAWNKIFKK